MTTPDLLVIGLNQNEIFALKRIITMLGSPVFYPEDERIARSLLARIEEAKNEKSKS